MSRISKAFANKAKIAYLTAGDGGIEKNIEYFLALVNGGINLLEVGIPYSDPVADGPVIQAAMERSLKANTTASIALEIVAKIREQSEAAMIVFTYYNPIQNDLAGFLAKVKQAGADGILVVDLPYEEAANYYHLCKVLDLAPITVVAPSTTDERMKYILHGLDSGFIYYACQKGTTGTRNGLPDDLEKQLSKIKAISKLPVAVGFGVANSQMVKEILAVSDGCVVGSYLVKHVADDISPLELAKVVKELYNVT